MKTKRAIELGIALIVFSSFAIAEEAGPDCPRAVREGGIHWVGDVYLEWPQFKGEIDTLRSKMKLLDARRVNHSIVWPLEILGLTKEEKDALLKAGVTDVRALDERVLARIRSKNPADEPIPGILYARIKSRYLKAISTIYQMEWNCAGSIDLLEVDMDLNIPLVSKKRLKESGNATVMALVSQAPLVANRSNTAGRRVEGIGPQAIGEIYKFMEIYMNVVRTMLAAVPE